MTIDHVALYVKDLEGAKDFFDKEQVDTLTGRMKADGWEVISGPRTTGDGYYESCVSGFEGNLIEITI